MQLFTQHMVHPTYGPFTKPDYINPPMKTTINSDYYVSFGAYGIVELRYLRMKFDHDICSLSGYGRLVIPPI